MKKQIFDINESIQYLIYDLQSAIKRLEDLKNKRDCYKEKMQSLRDISLSIMRDSKFKIQILDELPQELKNKNIDSDISISQFGFVIDNTDKDDRQNYIYYIEKYFNDTDRLIEYLHRAQKRCKKQLGNATIYFRKRNSFEYNGLLDIYFDDENKIIQILPNYDTRRLCEKMFKSLDYGNCERLFAGEIISPHLKKYIGDYIEDLRNILSKGQHSVRYCGYDEYIDMSAIQAIRRQNEKK